MVERRSELSRRYHRKKKMRKLKHKLATVTDGREKDKILRKIHLLSPQWNPAQLAATAAPPKK